jgi:predicted HTH transcriptional regulator
MRDGMKEAGLLEPSFEFSGFFTIILARNKVVEKKATDELVVSADRMERMLAILRSLGDSVILDIALLAERFGTSSWTIRRDLEMLEQHGWVNSVGATRNKQYSLTREGLKKLNDLD